MQVCGVLGQLPVSVLQGGFHKDDRFVLAVFAPGAFCSRRWNCGPDCLHRDQVRPLAGGVHRQMVPPTPPWMVSAATAGLHPSPWKLRRQLDHG